MSEREHHVRENVEVFVAALQYLLQRPQEPDAIESATGIALVLALMPLDASGLKLVKDALLGASRWPRSIRYSPELRRRWLSNPVLAGAVNALLTKSLVKTPQQ